MYQNLKESIAGLCKYEAKQGGDFDHDMKVKKAAVACCTDGVRPVIFRMERIED